MGQHEASAGRWVVVLAGGDGQRLRDYSMTAFGERRPKQFCHFGEEQTLLTRTVARARQVVPEDHILVVIQRAHRGLARESLVAFPRVRLVEQPCNRDTLPGLALPLLHIVREDPGALVMVLPSDHHVEDSEAFVHALNAAAARVVAEPGAVALLGAAPEGCDADYGWILPARGCEGSWSAVAAFREKPSPAEATWLARAGARINTLVLAARASRLVRMVAEARPDWVEALTRGLVDEEALELAYRDLPPANFSHEVLEHAVGVLRLADLGEVGWSDVGTPTRLDRVFGSAGLRAAS